MQLLSVLIAIVCLERVMLERGFMHWHDAELGKETQGILPQSPATVHGAQGSLTSPPSWPGQARCLPQMLIWGSWSPIQ